MDFWLCWFLLKCEAWSIERNQGGIEIAISIEPAIVEIEIGLEGTWGIEKVSRHMLKMHFSWAVRKQILYFQLDLQLSLQNILKFNKRHIIWHGLTITIYMDLTFALVR